VARALLILKNIIAAVYLDGLARIVRVSMNHRLETLSSKRRYFTAATKFFSFINMIAHCVYRKKD